MIRDFEIKEGTKEELEKLGKEITEAITEQLKAHGYTDEEIKQWFEEADKEEE
jgi:hypothetical protein